MKSKLTTRFVRDILAATKTAKYHDTEIAGFILQVSPKGKKTFYFSYRINGNRQTYKIGCYPDLTPTQARDLAKEKAGEVAKGTDIQQVKKDNQRNEVKATVTTLKGYMDHVYTDYMVTEKKTGSKIIQCINTNFGQWHDKQLIEINTFLVGNWRKQKLKDGMSPSGANRPIAYLRALLNHAYRQSHLIDSHPLETFKQLKEDHSKVVRYLSEDEAKSLEQAMVSRDDKARQDRSHANERRALRHSDQLNEVPKDGFSDHLTPIVKLALNTGMRRGEIFNLKWTDIDFKSRTLAVMGMTDNKQEGSKSGKTRIIPLNVNAFYTLTKWRKQTTSETYVFTGKNGKLVDIKKGFDSLLKLASIKTTAEAKQEGLPQNQGFWFHALRHTFASNLVMNGVDLNTVRELMGHSDLQMTMRYAHLSPNVKAQAVELIN